MDNENQNMAFITSEIHITYTEIISRSIQFIFVFKKKSMVNLKRKAKFSNEICKQFKIIYYLNINYSYFDC